MPSTSKVASTIRGNSADQTGRQKKTHNTKTTSSSGRRDTAALSEFGDDDRCEVAVGNSLEPKKDRRIKKGSKKSRVSKAVKRQSQSMRHMAEVIKRSLSKSDQSRSGSSGKNYAVALPSGMVKDVRGR